MAIGGPASFASGFFEGLARNRQDAQSRVRAQLNEALRLQKEDRESKDAIAREGLAWQKAKAELDQTASELSLIEQRRAQIIASPGKPFRDSNLEGALERARERFADAHAAVQERKGRLQDLIVDRDARIRGAVPPTKIPGTLLRGTFGIGTPEREVSPPPDDPSGRPGQRTDAQIAERKRAIVKGETENTPENREFTSELREDERNIRAAELEERQARGGIAGAERALEVGRAEQGPINEETRNKELYPLDKESAALRAKQVEAQAAMAAAAQRIQAQQQQQAALQAVPGYGRALQGGSATGKGGGGGGLLGAITNKGGGGISTPGGATPGPSQLAPGAIQMGGTPPPGPAGPLQPSQAGQAGQREPTVGQALGPVVGRLMQMPTPQAIAMVRSVLGGAPPAGFAGKGSMGAGAMSNAPAGPAGRTSQPRQPAQPRQGPATVHIHLPPSGANAANAARQPPDKPAMEEPAKEWYHSHPEVHPGAPPPPQGPEAMGMQTYGGAGANAAKQAPLPAPDVGSVMGGYRFKGGNPRDKASWEQVQGAQ